MKFWVKFVFFELRTNYAVCTLVGRNGLTVVTRLACFLSAVVVHISGILCSLLGVCVLAISPKLKTSIPILSVLIRSNELVCGR